MAKKTPKQKSDAPIIAPSTATAAPEVPVLSTDALSKLTQRIQKDFDKVKESAKKGKEIAGKGRVKRTKNEGKRGGELESKETRERPMPAGEVPATGVSASRGKKRPRDTNGDSKPMVDSSHLLKVKPAHINGPAKDPFPRKPGNKGGIDKEALLKEIIELGGTQEDLDLVDGLDSDDDKEETTIQESGKKEKNMKREVESFIKEIGLDSGKYEDIEEEEEEEEEVVEEEEWESEGHDETDEDEEEEEGGDGNAGMMGVEKNTPFNAPLPVQNSRSKANELLFPPRPDWHAHELPPVTPPRLAPTPGAVQTLHTRAKSLLSSENSLYSTSHLTKSSDRQFLSTIMTSGTLSDKISALTLICQESPLHTTKTLETLLGLSRKKSRTQAIAALAAIKDLFASGVVLPPDRKLRFFAKQSGLDGEYMTDLHLLVWAYEDWLKNFYFEVLETLESACTDQLVFARNHAVGYVWELLKEKPEQEGNLLRLLINKLGDTDKKVASKVSYLLLQLQSSHPAMKSIIINTIESEVVFRPGNTLGAKYYAIITLNQTILSSREAEVANKLLELYFSVFTSILAKDNKFKASAGNTATGANSAAPGKEGNDEKKDRKMNRKAKARAEAEEKKNVFEEEMYAKLISAVLTGVNRAFPFSNIEENVFQKHIDTLFMITHSGNFNTSIQALILIYQVSSNKQIVSDRFYRTLYESLLDIRLVNSSKQAMYLNLLFRALKSDLQIKRVKAFVKRIVQSATLHQPPFICGILYLLSELESNMPGLRSLLEVPEENEEDEEEVFKDVPEEGDEAKQKEEKETRKRVQYDGRKRDPLYAAAERSCLWELVPFLSHFHPTVALFATHFLESKPMPSKPDLGMHTLSHFLDRFVYRNAKASHSGPRGSSIMQPLSGYDTKGVVISTRGTLGSKPLANSEQFWKRKIEDVGVDEVFFHKYFNQAAIQRKGKKNQKDKNAKNDDDASDDEEDEDADEDEVWNALVKSRPELEGDDKSVDFDDEELNELEDEDVDISDAGVEGETVSFTDDDDDDDDDVPDFDNEEDVWDSDEVPEAVAFKKDQKDHKATSSLSLRPKKAHGLEDEGKVKNQGDAVKRRKLKHLPTFASVEDYADMLSD